MLPGTWNTPVRGMKTGTQITNSPKYGTLKIGFIRWLLKTCYIYYQGEILFYENVKKKLYFYTYLDIFAYKTGYVVTFNKHVSLFGIYDICLV